MTNQYGTLTPRADTERDGSLLVDTTVPYPPSPAAMVEVLLDGNTPLVPGIDWIWSYNSTGNFVVQLYPALLDRLAPGTHTLQAVFEQDHLLPLNYAEGSLAWKLPAPTAVPTAAPAQAAAAAVAASPQTGDIGMGPYVVFAVSGGLMVVWLGMQLFKRRGRDD